ncbi:phage major capsid protein [Yersinia ruckeri]|uniref:phage major capsid protein n=1 Tax=Yersinia ruckeri TaxID=29486 RepID=UPI000B43BF3F|nr:phage major capsid protein [Yersinia ruckeri]EKN4700363.1 phage major capsid protein [Yersinia ruckeri]MCW6563895.1 phage major capsid protein [Yersinia ruckeri]MCW6573571.1 phage major capsid protein [Yersinia ruckeri]MCW6583592.1 phage major capsid protein [Yersinia ruckeri]MCW6595529.1 phage major capsid protein [Yersinia ruckeri]
MMTIEELRRLRAGVNEKVNILAQKEIAGGQLAAEELTQFTVLEAEFAQLSTQIARMESAETMAGLVAQPVNASQHGPAVIIKQEADQYKGASMARMVMSIAAGKGDLSLAAKFAEHDLGDKGVSMAISTAAGSGGALIPQNMHSEVIELLRDRTIVRKLGARSIPLPNGNLSLPRMSGGATAGYVGEGSDVKASSAALDDVKLSAKTMIAMVPMSNQLIGRAGFQVEQLVLGDILTAIAVREDKAFLRDDGSNSTPMGMKVVATTAKRTVAWEGTDINLTTVDTYLDSMILKAMDSNSNMITCGWGLSNRSYMKLFGLRDGNGNKVYPEMATGLLKGYPIERTGAIPANLGTGSNESEIYFADFNDVVIGEDGVMTVDFSKEASYIDADGNTVSAFARNQSLIRVVTEHDIGFRHPEGLVLGTGVIW